MPLCNPRSLPVTILLTAMVALGPVSTDLYLPSLPSLTGVFSTTVSSVQLTLSVFIGGFAVATLIYGPLSDRYGRRFVALSGMILFVIGSLGCLSADTIESLIAWRFIQAVGGCSGPVVARAIVRDLYGRADAARMLSYMASTMAMAPAIAPMLGGWLHVTFGWRSHFVVLALFGLVIAVLIYALLAETNKSRDPLALSPWKISSNISRLFRSRPFMAYVLTISFAYSALFTFISISSFVVIDVLGVRPDRFGFLFFFVAFGFITGSLTGGRLTPRLGIDKTIAAGCAIGLAAALIGSVMSIAGIETGLAVIPPVIGIFFACGLVLPNGTAGALMPFPTIAGTSSSIIGFLQMGIGASIAAGAGWLHDGTTQPLFLIMAGAWLISATVFAAAYRAGFTRQSNDAKNA